MDSITESAVKFSRFTNQLPTSMSTLQLLAAQKNSWMTNKTKKCMGLFLFLVFVGCFGMYYVNNHCSGSILCNENRISQLNLENVNEVEASTISVKTSSKLTFEDVLDKDFQFNIENHDVMVFLHIQKTGGTSFGKHLVHNLELKRKCVCHRKIRKRCTCLRPGNNSEETWLFSRYSTGWKCGLHADWTELNDCVEEMMNEIDDKEVPRRYFYITYLRDPIHRYLSEFRHVGRGATWKNSRLFCGGRSATAEEMPVCYDGEYWDDLTLEDFLSCDSNLAHNRQTRMLADLTLVNCYNTSIKDPPERDKIMLESAKSNLRGMVFLGLTEEQEKSQYIFEETFNLKFNTRFDQYNLTVADRSLDGINESTLARIRQVNHLDIQLYQYAKQLFKERYEKLKSLDTEFHDHFSNMGHMDFTWDDIDNR